MRQRFLHIMMLAILANSIVMADNTKQYCVPQELQKYNPSPVVINDPFLKEFELAISTGLAMGTAVNTITYQNSQSPMNIFMQTHAALNATQLQPVNTATTTTSFLPLNNVIVAIPTKNMPVIYSLNDIVNKVYQAIITPVTASASSSTAATYPNVSTADANRSATINNDNNNTNKTKYDLVYSDIEKNILGNVDPTKVTASSQAPDIYDITISGIARLLALQSCYNQVNAANSSSNSTSSSSTSTSSTSTQMPSDGSSNNVDITATTLSACSGESLACMMLDIKNNLANNISFYADGYIQTYPNDTVVANDAITNVNNINSLDFTKYSNSNQSFPTNCMTASPCTSNCPTSSDYTDDASNVISYLKNLIPDLNKMTNATTVDLISQAVANKKIIQNENYLVDIPLFDLNTLIFTNTFGEPNTTNPSQCSSSSDPGSTTLAMLAANYINTLSDSREVPLFASGIATDATTVLAGSGFSSLANSNTIPNSNDLSSISTARKSNGQKNSELADQYNKEVRSFITKKNIALGNLSYLYNQRAIAYKIPSLTDTKSPYCTDGINTNDSSNCSFANGPYSNINPANNILAGQNCTEMELISKEAQFWTQLTGSATISNWQQQMQTASALEVTRAQTYLLDLINRQTYRNQQLHQRILSTMAVMQLGTLDTNKTGLVQSYKNLTSTQKKYLSGNNS